MEYISDVTREADLALTAITRSQNFQVRSLPFHESLLIRKNTVDDYAELMKEGVDMNPLEVVEEIDDDAQPTGRFLLADGYHRYQAHQQLGHEFVRCRIRQGNDLTALLLAACENGGRGLQYLSIDRERVAEMLLIALAKRGITWSDVEIARHAGIHRSTVAKVRTEINSRYTLPDTRQVVRNGTAYTMTPGQRHVYQYDELLDSMPMADVYIEPPSRTQPSRSPSHSRPHTDQRRVTSAQYHAPTPVSLVTPHQGQSHSSMFTPREDGNRLLDQPLSAGAALPADGIVFRIGWQRMNAGTVQAQGMVSANDLAADLRAALEDWLRQNT